MLDGPLRVARWEVMAFAALIAALVAVLGWLVSGLAGALLGAITVVVCAQYTLTRWVFGRSGSRRSVPRLLRMVANRLLDSAESTWRRVEPRIRTRQSSRIRHWVTTRVLGPDSRPDAKAQLALQLGMMAFLLVGGMTLLGESVFVVSARTSGLVAVLTVAMMVPLALMNYESYRKCREPLFRWSEWSRTRIASYGLFAFGSVYFGLGSTLVSAESLLGLIDLPWGSPTRWLLLMVGLAFVSGCRYAMKRVRKGILPRSTDCEPRDGFP